jgi:hypothetical protein
MTAPSRRVCALVAIVIVGGCGTGGIQGTLRWDSAPTVSSHGAHGVVENTTSHSQPLSPKSMRLLDDRGRRVAGRITVGDSPLRAHASTTLRVSWKSGNPVRIDYGAGTLALPSP